MAWDAYIHKVVTFAIINMDLIRATVVATTREVAHARNNIINSL